MGSPLSLPLASLAPAGRPLINCDSSPGPSNHYASGQPISSQRGPQDRRAASVLFLSRNGEIEKEKKEIQKGERGENCRETKEI